MAQTVAVISNLPGLEQWRQALNTVVKGVLAPRIPWNFQVTNKQGGNYLTWQEVSGADGYVVEVSTNGDFSTGTTQVKLHGNANVAYFDSVPTSGGVSPAIRYYRIWATAGTTTEPQSVNGLPTGVISSTAIAPNDTTTTSTTGSDTTTTDRSQSGTRTGNYRQVLRA